MGSVETDRTLSDWNPRFIYEEMFRRTDRGQCFRSKEERQASVGSLAGAFPARKHERQYTGRPCEG